MGARALILKRPSQEATSVRLRASLQIICLGAFSSNNLMSFYFFFEGALIPVLAIILMGGASPERLLASAYLIIYTVCARLPLLGVITYVGRMRGTFFFFFPHNMFIIHRIRIFALLAFLVKVPLYIFHRWLPKAHVEAPVEGSILLAGILLKLGPYGLIRVISINPQIGYKWGPFLLIVALVGSLIPARLCLRQVDIKALVAYASIRHIGLVVAGIFSISALGWLGAWQILIAHGIVRAGLFAGVNFYYNQAGSRSVLIIKGILTVTPVIRA